MDDGDVDKWTAKADELLMDGGIETEDGLAGLERERGIDTRARSRATSGTLECELDRAGGTGLAPLSTPRNT